MKAVLASLGLAAALVGCGEANPSTIGATTVPELHCEEDEVIAFDPFVAGERPITCVHIDNLDVTCDAFETEAVVCVHGNTGKKATR